MALARRPSDSQSSSVTPKLTRPIHKCPSLCPSLPPSVWVSVVHRMRLVHRLSLTSRHTLSLTLGLGGTRKGWCVVERAGSSSTMAEGKLVFESSERNKEPIVLVLEDVLREKFGSDASLQALEVASGSGQHVVHFAKRFPKVQWQPSDLEEKHTASVKEYVKEEGVQNVSEPLVIDVCKAVSEWPGTFTDASLHLILNINMVHISPWVCTEALFRAAGQLLRPKGIMVTYGPYAVHGEITPESNVTFNESLKSRNAAWGLRDVDDLEKEAKKNGMTFDAMFNMPSNNKILVWQKTEGEAE